MPIILHFPIQRYRREGGDIYSNTSSAFYTTGNINGNLTIGATGNITSIGGSDFDDADHYINGTVTNNGYIYSGGGYGIAATGNITNNEYGSVSASGISAYDVRSLASNVTINNYGNVTTAGTYVDGIFSNNANKTIYHYGNVNAAGTCSSGIRLEVGSDNSVLSTKDLVRI